ncbi:TrlF family AAA-like ATPase [Arenimonas sp.]|uniref:TrlF family AAA-like ATPase n=1 Tax=Arenimonas sp. TaxID=1872635 RepID=UPI0035B4CD28
MSYDDILGLPRGARFYKCALQVNPYEYLLRHGKQSSFASEADYNKAIAEACKANHVEVVGVADHYRIKPAESLINALQDAGIVVFPGFEAVTKDGVHFLVLFDPSKSVDIVQGYIHACGIHGIVEGSPTGDKDAQELLEESRKWGAQVIAAHCTQSGGLFQTLSGQPRINLFRHPLLNACALPGPLAAVPELSVRRILENREPEYQRDRKVAIVNAGDVYSPAALGSPSSTTFIRMDTPTIEGLRHAFLDHDSRIRLNTDPEPQVHPEILGMEVESERFLKGLKVRFNDGLNVLIGGRGAGKSALVECLRYALGVTPLGAEAVKAHKSIIEKVACSGTKITLHVQTYRPDRRRYRIERVVSQDAKVFDEYGDESSLRVHDLLGAVSVYGQSELAELARDKMKLTELFGRYVEADRSLDEEEVQVANRLRDSRQRITAIASEIDALRERQAPLSGMLTTLERYKESGAEERLAEQSAVVRSEGLITLARERLQPIFGLVESLKREVPIPKGEFEGDSLYAAAAPDSINALHATLLGVDEVVGSVVEQIESALSTALVEIDTASAVVAAAKENVAGRFEATLRELQKEKIDGADFIRLREQAARLKPLSGQIERLEQQTENIRSKRQADLARSRELADCRIKRLETTAKRVSKALEDGLRVTVVRGMDRRNLTALVRGIGGRLAEAQAALEATPSLDVGLLAAACREGPDAVVREFSFPAMQAAKLCAAGEDFFMALEQTDLLPVTRIEFNIAPPKGPAQWKELDDLSVGQKATALLYLLMLDSDSPLILDQPEDNLDNRFVSKTVVPMVRNEKRRRQLIFATHNANIPVLGDAEQIVAIDADGEAERGRIRLESDHMGSIDVAKVAVEVKELLEGGREAFEDRRVRYGF